MLSDFFMFFSRNSTNRKRVTTYTNATLGSKKSAEGAFSMIEMSVHPLLASMRAVPKPEGLPPTITAPSLTTGVREAAGDDMEALPLLRDTCT